MQKEGLWFSDYDVGADELWLHYCDGLNWFQYPSYLSFCSNIHEDLLQDIVLVMNSIMCFSSLVFIVYIYCNYMLFVCFSDTTANLLTSGPYGLIFASFIPFYLDIPVSTRFRVFGVNFSDKSFIYLAGVQLLLSSWKRSIFPGICGIIAGSLYRLNILGIRKAKVIHIIIYLSVNLLAP
jgi:hypothetical protein